MVIAVDKWSRYPGFKSHFYQNTLVPFVSFGEEFWEKHLIVMYKFIQYEADLANVIPMYVHNTNAIQFPTY